MNIDNRVRIMVKTGQPSRGFASNMSLRARGSGKWEMALQGWIPVLMSCNRGLWDYRSQPPRYTVTEWTWSNWKQVPGQCVIQRDA